MADKEFVLEGFCFPKESDYVRAKKEMEMIEYVNANTEPDDMKLWLKFYNKAVDKGSFQTVIGQRYLSELRERLAQSDIVSEDMLAPIPTRRMQEKASTGGRSHAGKNELAERYKKLYEQTKASQTIRNFLIAVLILVIAGMFIITGMSRYSVFTYFTDYETKIREQVTDEMESWQNELEQREKVLDAREAGSGRKGAGSGQGEADSGQDGAGSGQEEADSRQDGAGSGQEEADLGQDGADLGQDGADSGQEETGSGEEGEE